MGVLISIGCYGIQQERGINSSHHTITVDGQVRFINRISVNSDAEYAYFIFKYELLYIANKPITTKNISEKAEMTWQTDRNI